MYYWKEMMDLLGCKAILASDIIVDKMVIHMKTPGNNKALNLKKFDK